MCFNHINAVENDMAELKLHIDQHLQDVLEESATCKAENVQLQNEVRQLENDNEDIKLQLANLQVSSCKII